MATYQLDAAALHPDLSAGFSSGYYRDCLNARTNIKRMLKHHLAIEHDLFLLSNTTHGLVTILAGLGLEGFNLDTKSSRYKPYSELLQKDKTDLANCVPLITHVDPITGEIATIDTSLTTPIIVDAAQSFATVHYHHNLKQTDIFICPLHKHCGISTGLGLLGISSKISVPAFLKLASVAEAGTSYLPLLLAAEKMIFESGGYLFNRLTLEVSAEFRDQMAKQGIIILTPVGTALPFISLKKIRPEIAHLAATPLGLSVKYFDKCNVTRISGAVRGQLGCKPLSRSKELQNELLRLTRGYL